jgi:hypothetical protein
MNWSNYGRWRHPKQWYELKKKNKVMDKFLDFLLNFSDWNTKNGFHKALGWGIITMVSLTLLLNYLL